MNINSIRMKMALFFLGKQKLIANVDFYGTLYLDAADPITMEGSTINGFNKTRLCAEGAAIRLDHYANEYKEWMKTNTANESSREIKDLI